MPRSGGLLLLALCCTLAAPASASELGDRLNHRLKGGWGVLEVEVYSACSATYSDNEVSSAGVASKAPNRFAAGELVKVDKVKVKRQRVDLMLTLDAPLRVAHMDGPFELYEQRPCRVQLIVPLSRELVKNADVEGLVAEVVHHLTLYPSREEARMADGWNGRETKPMPEGYEETLQRHAVWRAEQTNIAVTTAIDHALTEAAHTASHVDDDADYLAGFAKGAERMADFSITGCESLSNAAFTSYRHKAPSDTSRGWEDGWEDGQKLVFYVLVADRLRSCLVPVPPLPTP